MCDGWIVSVALFWGVLAIVAALYGRLSGEIALFIREKDTEQWQRMGSTAKYVVTRVRAASLLWAILRGNIVATDHVILRGLWIARMCGFVCLLGIPAGVVLIGLIPNSCFA